MRNTINATACAALLEDVSWTDPSLLASLAILAFINVLVIVGNCLVIAAVFCSSKLRSVTNLFIVSLAVADLMVGLAVLPFSATWEIFKVWIFGDLWCSIWLAMDVWMCTASILNLCAISLDRYVAVTRPVTYPSIMSHSRAKMLIAGLWVLSFVICFPPLVGWKDKKIPKEMYVYNSTHNSSIQHEHPPCPYTCELTNEAGYVVYSALGSFYIPMFVMLFFYWRIYKAAVRTTRAINQGFRTTKGSRGVGNRFDEPRLTLRIHRGRGSMLHHGSPHSNGSNSTTTTGSASPASSRSHRGHERIKISVSYASNENLGPPSSTNATGGASGNTNLTLSTPTSPNHPPSGQPMYTVHYTANGKDQTATTLFRDNSHNLPPPTSHLRVHHNRRAARRSSSCDSTMERDLSPSPSDLNPKPKIISRRMGKRNIKAQVKRFRMETKAAKTLAIIVGGFIFCWLPFFTMYLIRAFCEECINPIVFSILFWLGYCNSAINPLIYALFSKDFRFAFKRIICRCFCKRTNMPNSRRGSDGSQMQGRQFRSPSYNTNQVGNSLGEDSDPGGDPSDSR